MLTKDWITLAMSAIALLVSITSLYFGRRRDSEDRQIAVVRSYTEAFQKLAIVRQLIHNKIERLRALEKSIRQHGLDDKLAASIATIQGKIDHYGKMLGIIYQMDAEIQRRSIQNKRITRRARIHMETTAGRCELLRGSFEASETNFAITEKDILGELERARISREQGSA